MNKNKKNIFILLIILLIFLIVVISSFFVAFNMQHIKHCHKEDCSKCKVINISNCFLTNIFVASIIYLNLRYFRKIIIKKDHFKNDVIQVFLTLISLKVQFNT